MKHLYTDGLLFQDLYALVNIHRKGVKGIEIKIQTVNMKGHVLNVQTV